jgi:hypothetical protein
VSGFFGIVGMAAIFSAAAIPIMVTVGVLEAAKLALQRGWRSTGGSPPFAH